MSDSDVTVTGNLTSDIEVRFTPNGVAVGNFDIAINRRTRNANGEWQDGDAMFLRCTVWRDNAENAAETLRRGDRVIVIGELYAQYWEDAEGNKRSRNVIDVREIGPSLRFATGTLAKVSPAKDEPPAKPTPTKGSARTSRR